jgi:hypothetical protein
MATASRGEPEPRPSAEKERLSQKDELNALYRRRQNGEISQAEYSELRLGIIPDGRSNNPSDQFTVLWVAAGFVFGLVPGIVSLIVRPGWGSSAVTQYANAGTAVYLVLLALSGLGVAAIGLRFGLTGRATEGWAAAVRMYPGVVVGTWLSVIFADSGSLDIGAAATLFAILIGYPYWACAGFGLVVGSAIFRIRTKH